MEKSIMEKLKEVFIPSLVAGGIGIGLYYALESNSFSESVPLNLLNIEVPAYAVVGGAITLGNMGGEILTEVVTPMITQNRNLERYEEMVIPPALSSLATYGAIKLLLNTESPQMVPLVAIGAGSSIAGNFIYGKI